MEVRVVRSSMNYRSYVTVSTFGVTVDTNAGDRARKLAPIFDIVHMCGNKSVPLQTCIEIFSDFVGTGNHNDPI